MESDDKVQLSKKIYSVLTAATLFIVGASATSAHADTTDSSNTATVLDVQPASTADANVGYFIRKVTSGNIQLSVRITNPSKNAVSVKGEINNALASPNGGSWYITKTKEKYSKFVDDNYAFAKYTTGPSIINLAGKESKVVTYTVDTSKLPQGVTLGGLSFVDNKPNKAGVKNKVTVYTQTRRLLSVELTKGTPETGKLTIGKAKVVYDASFPYIAFNITNSTNNLTQHIALGYKIENINHKTLINSKPNNKQRWLMPSKTTMQYLRPWTSKYFEPGTYYVTLYGKVDGNSVSQTRKVVVHEKTVKGYTKLSKTTPIVQVNYLWLVLLLGGIIIVLVGLFIVLLKRKNNKDDKK